MGDEDVTDAGSDEQLARLIVSAAVKSALSAAGGGERMTPRVAKEFIEDILSSAVSTSNAGGMSEEEKRQLRRGSKVFHTEQENNNISPRTRGMSMDPARPVSSPESSSSGDNSSSGSSSSGSESESDEDGRTHTNPNLPIEYRFYQDGHHNSAEEDEWLCRPQFDTKKDKVSPVDELEHLRHVYMGIQVYEDTDDTPRAADREGIDWVLESSLPAYSKQAARAHRPFKAKRIVFQKNKWNQITWVRFG